MIHFDKFIPWLGIFGTTCLAAAFAYWLGFFHYTWDNDFTKLSFVIMAIYVICSLIIGMLTFVENPSKWLRDKMWFASNTCVDLGLIGTVIGFIYLFSETFTALDITNPDDAKKVILSIATGMSTALLTTLFGMGAKVLLQVQLELDKEEEHV